MGRLDPRLRLLEGQDREALRLLAGRAVALTAEGETPARAHVIVEFAGELSDLEGAGLAVQSVVGGIATGSVEIDRLRELAAAPGVTRVDASSPMKLHLNESRDDVKAVAVHAGPPGLRGTGVIVGIVDSGIDFTHGGFCNPDGSSRILALWDQRLEPIGSEAPPADFSYGVEYTQAIINAALSAGDPFQSVRHRDLKDAHFHGTHVAGIAAGNGSTACLGKPPGTFVGIAPEADLVFVATRLDTDAILDAVKYIFDLASLRGRPVVVNLSFGETIGPHDGTSIYERRLDAHLAAARGRAIVAAAGNEQIAASHGSGSVELGSTESVRVKVPPGVKWVAVDIWYPGTDVLDIRVTPPGGTASPVVTPLAAPPPPETHRFSQTLMTGESLTIDSVLNDPGNADCRIFVTLNASAGGHVTAGDLRLDLTATAGGSVRFDAWTQTNSPLAAAKVLPPHRALSGNVTPPATAREVIAVGSHITKNGAIGAISPFSSAGPTRDDRPCPHLTAPGEVIVSAQPMREPDPCQGLLGTSASAPHVTGAVALMLQVNHTLTPAEIRDRLARSARSDKHTHVTPNTTWGHGKLDVAAAVDRVAAIPAAVTRA